MLPGIPRCRPLLLKEHDDSLTAFFVYYYARHGRAMPAGFFMIGPHQATACAKPPRLFVQCIDSRSFASK